MWAYGGYVFDDLLSQLIIQVRVRVGADGLQGLGGCTLGVEKLKVYMKSHSQQFEAISGSSKRYRP